MLRFLYAKMVRYRVFIGGATLLCMIPASDPIKMPATGFYALGLVVLGLLLRLSASGMLYKNRKLAEQGPYSLFSHPLYWGSWLSSCGVAAATGRLWLVPIVAFAFAFLYRGVMQKEERELYRRFEQSRVDHFLATRGRWLPAWNGRELLKMKWSWRRVVVEHSEWQAWLGFLFLGGLFWWRWKFFQ